MQRVYVLCIFSLASTCCCDEAACDADGQDDKSVLLQGGVGLASQHGKGAEKVLQEGLETILEKGSADSGKEAADKGFPDIFKKITGAISGASNLDKDFEAVKTAATTFSKDVHTKLAFLASSAKTAQTLDAVVALVEQAYAGIHAAALKLFDALTKATSGYMASIGKVAPATFTSSMKSVLDKASAEAKSFAETFAHAGQELKAVASNKTLVCGRVKFNLDAMHKKAEELVTSVTGFSTNGLNKEVLKAKDALPAMIKKEVDTFLSKANEAAEGIKNSISPAVKDISNGIASAFEGHCSGLQSGAGRLQVGLISTLGLVLLGFSM